MKVVYQTDINGNLLYIEPKSWAVAAAEFGSTAALDPSRFIGRNMADLIADSDSRLIYRGLLKLVNSGVRERVSYCFSCSPDEKIHNLRLQIMRIPDQRLGRLLHMTKLIRAVTLPKIATQDAAEPPGLVRVCSYCEYYFDDDALRWVPREVFLGRFVTAPQRNHGICPACREFVFKPLLASNCEIVA